MMIGEACRFYSWRFDDCWRMPARRFFAMLRAARRIRIYEAQEEVRWHSIPLTSAKYVEGLEQGYRNQLHALSGFDPNDFVTPKTGAATATPNQVLNVFMLRKQLHGR